MATIVTGNFAARIGDPSLGTGVYGPAVLASATSSLITVNYPQIGAVEHYSGAFLYDGSGSLAGGTLTAYDQVQNGQYVIQASGLNLSATSVATLTLAGNSAGLMTLALGGSDQIWGGIYDDWINGGAGADTIIALDGNDSVYGGAGADDLNGNKGNDRVLGEDGADWVRGGQGNDTVSGGVGDDPHINGNLGDDFIYGSFGDDTAYGGQGNDVVGGEEGDDVVYGDLGNDILIGGLGTDMLVGGAGTDLFVFNPGDGIDAIADLRLTEGDRIVLKTGTTFTITTVGAYLPAGSLPGYEGSAIIDIHNNTDLIVVLGVTPAQLGSSWVTYF